MEIAKRTGWLSLLAVAAALLFAPVAGAADALKAEQREHLATAIALYQERSGAPAVSVYVDQGGAALFRADVGLADVGAHHAVGPDSVYGIGSITKSFTAHAVLSLVAAGRMRLEDKVGALLPDYVGPGAEVTVEQLL